MPQGFESKKGLGRGLDSLFGTPETIDITNENKNFYTLKNSSEGKSSDRVWNIPIEQIRANSQQPRRHFSREALEGLARSISEKGILQPIVVRPSGEDSFEIVAGERRWRAAQIAGLHSVRSLVRNTTNQDAGELALIENIQREDLNPIEEAEAYECLIDNYGLTQQGLAERMGKQRTTIANLLRLLNLSPPVRQMLLNQEISLGKAKLLVSVKDEKLQKHLAERVRGEGVTVRQVQKIISQAMNPKKPQQESTDLDKNLSQKLLPALCEDLQKNMGTKVGISYKKGRGQLHIHFYSDEELNQLVTRLKK